MKDKILNEVEFDLLRKFQEHVPGAIIAGGSVRDMQHELLFSDVDIFYNANILPYAYLYDEIIPRIFSYTNLDRYWRVTNSAFARSDSVYGEDTLDIVELEKKDGSRYQFISVSGDPKGHVHKFDLNCCKVFHDGTKVHNTGDYKEFCKTKYLNVADNYKNSKYFGSGRLGKRVDKIMFRYKHLGIKISTFLENHLKQVAIKDEETKKKNDDRFKKIKLQVEADQAMHSAMLQQIHDNAALASQPVYWSVPIPIGVQTHSTGNPLGPSAAGQGGNANYDAYYNSPQTQGLNMTTPFIEAGGTNTYSVWPDEPIFASVTSDDSEQT